MKSNFSTRIILALCTLFLSMSGYTQVTTATLTGVIEDDKNETLIGAAVIATHEPSGSRYAAVTREDGLFTIPNMRVGGPYSVKVTFVGYKDLEQKDIFLNLNQKTNLKLKMVSASSQLDAVTVTSKRNDIMGADRTGAETSINAQTLAALPTISRSQADFTRLNPMAAEGGSFAGRNDQFNNFSVDGTIFNNPFGLDASTPGGQADAQPISLDALEQINVAIAPYDVTQAGFTGASVNAVTKSGTNDFKGTAFGFFRNKSMYGGTVDGTEVNKGDLSQTQFGASLGGPIIKNRLFFFANYESSKLSDFGSFFLANRGQAGANVSRVLASDLDAVSNVLKSKFGYDSGTYENYKHNTNSYKALLKFDLNINDNNKLSVTFNTLDASKDKPANPSAIGRRGPDATTLQFQNSGYRINNKIYSGIVELKSAFGSKASNKIQLGYTSFVDSRDPFSEPFPVINISKNGVRYIVAGHEPFSISNRLNQKVLQINDNLNLYLGKHTVTVGASFEKFSFDNSFNLTGYGARVFFPDVAMDTFVQFVNKGGLDGEVAGAKKAFTDNQKAEGVFGGWALAQTNLGQAALYAQDEIAVNKKLTLTAGVRVDMPLYFDTETKMAESIKRNGAYDPTIQYYDKDGAPIKLNSLVFPKQTPLFSPRVGFNYDVMGDRSQVLRGGTGLFTGRFPFVWIGNQVANPNFFFYCVTDPDFKFPQVWRTNLGYDYKTANNWVASLDLIYTKDINGMMTRNYGLRKPSGKLSGVDNRPIYLAADRATVFGGATNAYVFTNTDLGSSFNAAFQLEKTFESGMYLKFGYNYLDAQDAASIDAEISSDAYDRNPANIQNTNTAELAPSLYGNKHRFIGVFSKKFTYGGGKMATLVSIFTEFAQGGRYSYTYSGDINGDGSGLNDLLFVPTDAQINQMAFRTDGSATPAEQRAAFKFYIAQDDYLNRRRGEYTKKYDALSPWYSRWDVRIAQEFVLKNKQSIQISMDILNFGNLINSSWGVRQFASQTGLNQQLAVSVDKGVPTYEFDLTPRQTFVNDFSLSSRWQMQLGLRYTFGN
jgi:Carboxypeptidase regulatory-like domain/TonB dependent receptor